MTPDDSRERRHEVPGVDAAYFLCSECGAEVTTEDGEVWWHKDRTLDPPDDSEQTS